MLFLSKDCAHLKGALFEFEVNIELLYSFVFLAMWTCGVCIVNLGEMKADLLAKQVFIKLVWQLLL